MKTKPSVLREADAIINGARRKSYGNADESFRKVAAMWSAIVGEEITARQVCLCMIALKVCRESHRPSRDNAVDICGYAGLLEQLQDSIIT